MFEYKIANSQQHIAFKAVCNNYFLVVETENTRIQLVAAGSALLNVIVELYDARRYTTDRRKHTVIQVAP